jgi:RND superfamily putative drug exporter
LGRAIASLGSLAGGAQQLSGGATQLGNGVSQAGGGTSQLRAGLSQASGYLHDLSRLSGTAGLNTFYMPANRLNDPQFTLARYYSLSSDGTTARFLVLGRDDPFGDVARNRIALEQSAVNGALSGTTLAGARVLVAGDAALNANLSGLFGNDFTVVAVAVMLGVFIVLVLLLRSLLAPFYLLLSVLLSYSAAMGITTFVWQDLLHHGAIDWTVGIFAFMMLVSVGADYNLFLMSRVREEVQRDPVHGIRNAVQRTGAIITSAGVIFAGTFAALIASGLTNISETGFAITCGLLLDTFLVRSFLVPALAVMLGRWNWWPRGIGGSTPASMNGHAAWPRGLLQQPLDGLLPIPQEACSR